MAKQSYYQRFHVNKSQPLGRGSYGAVYKAKCDQLPCAAKVLHPTILDPTDPGAGKIMERFQQECAFLEGIRHPNIVQYLGVASDPESRLPVLLMELLDESLTKMLEHSQQSLAYYVQVNICHDIALAVAYLHSNDIIHRDLSSNNVLMIAGRRAKVTDFGMSKLAGAAPSMTPLTMCPGTLAYMSPEALREPPSYTKKLDCFSEGVIMIQVCTRLWPEPGPRIQVVPDSRSPTGIIEMPVLETERRKSHIDLIDPNNALLSIAKDCLHYVETERPSSEELCQGLAALKDSSRYSDSVQEEESARELKDNQIKILARELRSMKESLQKIKDEIKVKRDRVHEKDKVIQQLRQELASEKERLDCQLQELEKVISETQRVNQSLREQIQQLKCQLSQQNQDQETLSSPPSVPLLIHSQGQAITGGESFQSQASQETNIESQTPVKKKMILNWRDTKRAPFKMIGGAVAIDKNSAYFVSHSGVACVYYSAYMSWNKLQKCPYKGCSLANVKGNVTAIGGYAKKEMNVLDKLFSLQGGQWVEIFPSMPTSRYNTVAVTAYDHLIVAGGEKGISYHLDAVEVMDTETLVWSTVAGLPHPYTEASVSICGDQLYMLGGYDDKDRTKSVITCSVTDLLLSSLASLSVWHRVADAPAYHSTCATINGELLAVGGYNETGTNAIHMYNPSMNTWNLIGNMPTAACDCLVTILSTNEMLVVGGTIDAVTIADEAKIATFTVAEK